MTEFLDRLGYVVLKGLAFFLRLLPLNVAIQLGRFGGLCFFFFSARRRVAYADMKAALGNQLSAKERWKAIREHYKNHGQMLVEVLYIPKLKRDFINENVHINHLERYLELSDKDEGVVLMTAHYGNWELLQIISGLKGRPVNVLARDQKHSRLDDFLNELRQSHGSVAIKRGMGVRELLRSLRRHELVGVLGDQDAGRDQGLIMRFLGRKTTVPTGAFELAGRTNSKILPCFINRTDGTKHEINIYEAIDCAEIKEGGEEVLRNKVQDYLTILEERIKEHPNNWLWEAKRWKYTWTKRILILSDGKKGHLKQSQAVADQFKSIDTQYGRPGMEYPTETIDVQFRSAWHRKVFPWFAFFSIPFAQGRIRMLKAFFTEDCLKQLEEASADFIISAGSSLVPLNLYLAKESRAKSIVLMKPSFPFDRFEYDLVIVPMHDRGTVPKKEFRTLLAPSVFSEDQLIIDKNLILKELRQPNKVKMALFLGGSTRDFHMDYAVVEKLFSTLKRISAKYGDYVVTTSRRTPDTIASFLKDRASEDAGCQMLVIAKDDPRPEIVGGMMAVADILLVTEDSVSMISEAICSGKKVIVIDLETNKLPEKHKRFKRLIEEKADVMSARPEDLESILQKVQEKPAPKIYEREAQAIQGQLQEIL